MLLVTIGLIVLVAMLVGFIFFRPLALSLAIRGSSVGRSYVTNTKLLQVTIGGTHQGFCSMLAH